MLSKDEVKQIIENNKCNYWKVIKFHHQDFYEFINSLSGNKFPEKLYRWLNEDVVNLGLCTECSKPCKFDDIYYGFRKCCSLKCSNNSLETKNKKEKAYLAKYNVSNPSQAEFVKQKKKETCLKHFGVDCNLKLEITKNAIKQTNLKKYGKEYPIQNCNVRRSILDDNYNRFFTDIRFKHVSPLFSKEQYNGVELTYRWKCKTCNSEFEERIQGGKLLRCYNCFPQYNSVGQIEMVNYIKTITNSEIVLNDRKVLNGLELDIYIPALKLAVEYNGLYYHSEFAGEKGENYHLNKTLSCEALGIQLIHIFENEWYKQKEAIKLLLSNIILSKPVEIEKSIGIEKVDNCILVDRRFYRKLTGFKLIEVLPPKKHFISNFYMAIVNDATDDWIWDCGYIKYQLITA